MADFDPTVMRRCLPWLLRLLLAGTFIYAGLLKMADPLAFADSVASFQLLPTALITPFALGLPPYEILLGLLLLAPRTTRAAALGLGLLCVLFATALATAIARGLPIDCGCFGRSTWSTSPWFLLGRDAALGAVAVLLYRPKPGRLLSPARL